MENWLNIYLKIDDYIYTILLLVKNNPVDYDTFHRKLSIRMITSDR